DTERLQALLDELDVDYKKQQKRFTEYEKEVTQLLGQLEQFANRSAGGDDGIKLAESLRDDIILASQGLLARLSDDVLALQLIQARARTEVIQLSPVDLTPGQAFEIAQENRRDYANARASLVDSWRLIEFNADALESSLDLTFSGGIGADGNAPFDFRSDNGQLRVGLRWDSPITRLQERNTYRQSLIEFDQARRSFYQFEDGIWQILRAQVRQLQLQQLNFELARRGVRIATDQIALNEDIRQLREAQGLANGPTAARDTISALNDLLNAQNNLLNVWVNYEVVRRSLDLDLGTMELTPEGFWIDDGVIGGEAIPVGFELGEGEMLQSMQTLEDDITQTPVDSPVIVAPLPKPLPGDGLGVVSPINLEP
ncbi:MAG: hypothetical protein AAFP90_00055, partial [Planctomycetota bacterium]